MNNLCRFCNDEITGRDPRAKICLPCMNNNSKRIGATTAMSAIQYAIKTGKLAPAKIHLCVDCGKNAECYDHRDYNKPLDVVPVCRKCNHSRGAAIPVNVVQHD